MKKDIDAFLEYIEKQKMYSLNTKKNYEIDISEFMNYLKDKEINYTDVNYEFIKEYLVYMYNKKYKRNTIARKLSSLRSFYKYLFNNNIIKTNPFKYVKTPKKEKMLPKYLSVVDLETIFNVPNLNFNLGQRDRLILEILYATGIRVGELVEIKVSDIDFFNKEIKVNGKGNKQRIVEFGDYCFEYINLFLNDGREKILKKHNKTSSYLIINDHGDKITTRGVELLIDKIIKKAALKRKVTPHMLRHTFATHLLNEGCDILTVKELLGHESLESTQIYTHVSNEHLRKVYLNCHPNNKKM
ncbi:MAG: tyrosine recombinase [Tenericutes bacterium]|nr:tyrosine recombinase [Mycoplasmatota bacterium]